MFLLKQVMEIFLTAYRKLSNSLTRGVEFFLNVINPLRTNLFEREREKNVNPTGTPGEGLYGIKYAFDNKNARFESLASKIQTIVIFVKATF